jgi:hypothetical protein
VNVCFGARAELLSLFSFTQLPHFILIEAYDLAIEDTSATFQIASQAFAECGEALERISVSRDQPHAVVIGVQQRPEAVPFDLENPVRVREWRTGSG